MAPIKRRRKIRKTRRFKKNLRGSYLTRRQPDNQVFIFTRYAPENILTEAAAPVLTAAQFSLSQLTNYTEFTNLFQEYMITKVEIFGFPKSNIQATTTSAVQTFTPLVWLAFDPNDVVSPGSISEIQEMAGSKVFYGYKPFRFTIFPKVKVPAYITSAPTFGYSTAKKVTWIDTSNPTVPHFALKMGLPGNNNSASNFNSYAFNWRYTIACRRLK